VLCRGPTRGCGANARRLKAKGKSALSAESDKGSMEISGRTRRPMPRAAVRSGGRRWHETPWPTGKGKPDIT
jgi:hypothetical protein